MPLASAENPAEKVALLSALRAHGVQDILGSARTNWLKPLRPARPSAPQPHLYKSTDSTPAAAPKRSVVGQPLNNNAPSFAAKPSLPQAPQLQTPASALKPKPQAPEAPAKITYDIHTHGSPDAPVQVVVSADNVRANTAQFLPRDEEALWEKMLGSIGLTRDGVQCVVVGTPLPVSAILEDAPEAKMALQNTLRDVPQLVFGDVAKALMPSPEEAHTLYALPHPRTLLAQPMLKKLAWHVLQQFKKEKLSDA